MDNLKAKFAGVKDGNDVKVDDIIQHLKNGTEKQRSAFFYFLEKCKEIEDVELKTGHQGISGYCYNMKGELREAFYFSIRTTKDDLTIYQIGNAFDPKQIFNQTEPGDKRKKYGHISGQDQEENEAVLKIFKMCIIKLRRD